MPSPNTASRSRFRARWGLYLITDLGMLRDAAFLPLLEGALRSGVRVVQLRGKYLPDEEVLAIGREMRAMTSRHGATFVVNDRPDLAVRLEADGLHVGQDDPPPEEVRSILGERKLLGLSTHNREQIRDAQQRPIDYIGVGPVYGTATKERADPVVGVDLLAWAIRNSSLPVVAIGGITLSNLEPVLQTGVPNIAVISAIGQAPDPLAAAREFVRRIDAHQNQM